jgi:hypothetical protein
MENTLRREQLSKFSILEMKFENKDKSWRFFNFSSPLISLMLLKVRSEKKKLISKTSEIKIPSHFKFIK